VVRWRAAGRGLGIGTSGDTHVTPARFENIDLYNVEVEDFHMYFVGRPGETSVWTHNGLGGGCSIPKPAAVAEEAAVTTQRRTLYHYTTAKGHEGITTSETIRPSLKAVNPKDARYGDGQYLSDIVPGSKTSGQLSYAFLNDPRGWRRFTHYVEIDVSGLTVVEGRGGVSVIHNAGELNVSGRIVSSGPVPRPAGK